MTNLLSCPFCGSDPTLVDGEKGPLIYGAYVQCDGCGASQSIVPTAAEAVAAWNRRTPPAVEQTPNVELTGKAGTPGLSG